MDSEMTPSEIAAEQGLAIIGNLRDGYGLKDTDDEHSVWWPEGTITDARELLRAFVAGKGKWHS